MIPLWLWFLIVAVAFIPGNLFLLLYMGEGGSPLSGPLYVFILAFFEFLACIAGLITGQYFRWLLLLCAPLVGLILLGILAATIPPMINRLLEWYIRRFEK